MGFDNFYSLEIDKRTIIKRPFQENISGNLDKNTINITYNFFENISEIFEDEGYYTLSSLNSAITQNIKLNSMIYSSDINTANQFMMSTFVDIFYKKMYDELSKNSSPYNKSNIEKILNVSFDPLTITTNLTKGSWNQIPVFPIEATITCSNLLNNKLFSKKFAKIVETIANDPANFVNDLIFSNVDLLVTFYNYIIYATNLSNTSCSNSQCVEENSHLTKGQYLKKTNNMFIVSSINCSYEISSDKKSIKLIFFAKTNLNEFIKIGTIILAGSEQNIYNYIIGNAVGDINILGNPLMYDRKLLDDWFDSIWHTGKEDSETAYRKELVDKLDYIINSTNNFSNKIWRINYNNLCITSFNEHYEYYKIYLFNQPKYSSFYEFITRTIKSLNVKLDKLFNLYAKYLGVDLNNNQYVEWQKLLNTLVFFPISQYSINQNNPDSINFTFIPNILGGFTNLYNTFLLKQIGINFQTQTVEEALRIFKSTAAKKTVNFFTGNTTVGGDNNKQLFGKFKTNNGGGKEDNNSEKDDELVTQLSIPSLINTITFNPNYPKGNLLMYSEDYAKSQVIVVSENSCPKYGESFYYENYAVSQIEEGITRVFIDSLASEGNDINDNSELLLTNENSEINIYSLTNDSSSLVYIDEINMFNLFNSVPEDSKTKVISYDDDNLSDLSEYDLEYLNYDDDNAGVITNDVMSNEIIEMNIATTQSSDESKTQPAMNASSPMIKTKTVNVGGKNKTIKKRRKNVIFTKKNRIHFKKKTLKKYKKIKQKTKNNK